MAQLSRYPASSADSSSLTSVMSKVLCSCLYVSCVVFWGATFALCPYNQRLRSLIPPYVSHQVVTEAPRSSLPPIALALQFQRRDHNRMKLFTYDHKPANNRAVSVPTYGRRPRLIEVVDGQRGEHGGRQHGYAEQFARNRYLAR